MSELSRVEQSAIELQEEWDKQLVARSDADELIISQRIERLIENLCSVTREKREALRKKSQAALGQGQKRGRPSVETPSPEKLRELLMRKGATLSSVAKDLRVDRKTIANRLKEKE